MKCLKKLTKKYSKKQVRGAGGLASLAKKDWMNTRLRLTLTNHVVCVFQKKKVKIWQCLNKIGLKKSKKQVRGAGGLAERFLH